MEPAPKQEVGVKLVLELVLELVLVGDGTAELLVLGGDGMAGAGRRPVHAQPSSGMHGLKPLGRAIRLSALSVAWVSSAE